MDSVCIPHTPHLRTNCITPPNYISCRRCVTQLRQTVLAVYRLCHLDMYQSASLIGAENELGPFLSLAVTLSNAKSKEMSTAR
jgi:hypothetical protein